MITSNEKILSIVQLMVTSLTIGIYIALLIGYYLEPINSWDGWDDISVNLTIAALLVMPFLITIIGIVQISSREKGSKENKMVKHVAISALFSYIPFTVLIPFALNSFIIIRSQKNRED